MAYKRPKYGTVGVKGGLSRTRLYGIWCKIKGKCYTKTDDHYKWYGSRGITVCEEWKNSFITFREWALNNGYSDNLTIDRIDNNGNYEPSNCRWVDMKTQANNRRSNLYLTFNGETKRIYEWCKILGIKYNTLYMRYKRSLFKG